MFDGERVKSSDIEKLQQNVNRVVTLHCKDGEVLKAKLFMVRAEVGEVIYDLIDSTDPVKYTKAPADAAFLIYFDDIESVELP